MPFYKYRTDLGNTVTAKSAISFTGLTGNEAQISSAIDTPGNQQLYLYKVTGGLLVENDDSTMNTYFTSTGTVVNGSPTIIQYTGYTGTTAPAQFAAKIRFNTYTGTTAPTTYQTKTSITTLTGTTLPNTYVPKSLFSTYTGGTTNVTSASNGIRKNGNNVRLGGSLTGSTNIGLGTFNLVLTGSTGTIRYGSDLSASYNVRSLVDKGYVTGTTQSVITFKNNATTLNTPPVEFTTINFSSGATLFDRGSGVLEVKVLYGSEVFNTGKTTTQTNATATFTDYLAKGFTLAGGTYKIEYVCKASIGTANTNLGIQMLVDGVPLESGTNNLYRTTNANARTIVSAFKIITLAAGSHSFRVQFSASSGTATADYGWILITRIS